MGCSNSAREEIKVAVEHVQEVRPSRPAPIKLQSTTYTRCGNQLCVSPEDAQKDLRNKTLVGRWMGQANAVMDYYEKRDRSHAPVAAPVKY